MTPMTRILATVAIGTGLAAGTMAAADDNRGSARGPMLEFEAIDADADGTLTSEELIARATERLATADANGDGLLDRDELIAAMPAPGGLDNVFAPDPRAWRADRMLAFMDANESGQIAIAEVAERRVNALLARADADNDGEISASEAEAVRTRMAEHRHGHGHGAGQRQRDRN